MENTSEPIAERDLFYYRARQRNRLFDELTRYFAARAEHDGITKRDIARKLKRDPAQITRWLSQPTNLTLDTVSDLLLAMGAEMDCEIRAFDDYAVPNDIHGWASDYWSATAQHLRFVEPPSTEGNAKPASDAPGAAAKARTKFELA